MNQSRVSKYLNDTIGISETKLVRNNQPRYTYMQMLTGCFSTSLSNRLSLNSLSKNTHIAKNMNGSVGKLILIGVFGRSSDNSMERGVQNIMIINNLSSAKNARNPKASAKGTSVTRYDSFQSPTILAIMKRIAVM